MTWSSSPVWHDQKVCVELKVTTPSQPMTNPCSGSCCGSHWRVNVGAVMFMGDLSAYLRPRTASIIAKGKGTYFKQILDVLLWMRAGSEGLN